MIRYCIASDTHMFAPSPHHERFNNQLITPELLIQLDKTWGGNMVLLGDIIDATNSLRFRRNKFSFEVNSADKMLSNHFKARYTDTKGNHEGNLQDLTRMYYILSVEEGDQVRRYVCLHGIGAYIDTKYFPLAYKEKKTLKWSLRDEGKSKFYRGWYGFYREYINAHNGGCKEPSEKIKGRLVDVCMAIEELYRIRIEGILYGHTHNEWDGSYGGRYRVINFNKGISFVDL